MKKMLLACLLISITISTRAQSDLEPSFIKDSLDAYVNRAMTDWKIPGVAVCVVKNGKVLLMKGYGVKEMGGTDKVDENTLFMIGSNSKAFTATALAILDAEKKLSLDDLKESSILLLDEGHCFRDTTLDLCEQHQLHELAGFRGTSLETLKYMVAAANGVTFLPLLMAKNNLLPKEVKLIPITPTTPSRHISVAWRKKSPKEASLNIVTQVIRDIIQAELERGLS